MTEEVSKEQIKDIEWLLESYRNGQRKRELTW